MMKASFGRLRRFALPKADAIDIGELFPTAQIEGLARAAKDMQDMREGYDRLLEVAAAMANSAYEFSESLGEMGSCLEQIAPHNDQESGGILLMLGKVQFELKKLVDTYVSCMLQLCTFHEAICIIMNKTEVVLVSFFFFSFSVLKYSRPLHDLQSHFSVTLELLRI
jgi:hypothetical protein